MLQSMQFINFTFYNVSEHPFPSIGLIDCILYSADEKKKMTKRRKRHTNTNDDKKKRRNFRELNISAFSEPDSVARTQNLVNRKILIPFSICGR